MGVLISFVVVAVCLFFFFNIGHNTCNDTGSYSQNGISLSIPSQCPQYYFHMGKKTIQFTCLISSIFVNIFNVTSTIGGPTGIRALINKTTLFRGHLVEMGRALNLIITVEPFTWNRDRLRDRTFYHSYST